MNKDKLKLTEKIFDKYAKQYQDKYMGTALYQITFDVFLNNIKNDQANILDLACGPGNITKYLLSKKSGYQILGLDISSNMIGLAKTNNPTAKFKQADCREIHTFKSQYDGIMCGFCALFFKKRVLKTVIGCQSFAQQTWYNLHQCNGS